MNRIFKFTIPLVLFLFIPGLLVIAPGFILGDSGIVPELTNTTRQELETDAAAGAARIIASLNVDFTPEGELSETAKEDQRQAINQKQETVLGQLDGTDYVKTARMKTVPQLGLILGPEALDEILQMTEVKSISKQRPLEPLLEESVPFIQGTQLQQMGIDGTDQVVAVLDTGIDPDHPAFSFMDIDDRIVAEACFSSGQTPESVGDVEPEPDKRLWEGDCPDGTGRQIGPGSGVPLEVLNRMGDLEPADHGTHVGGIAGGSRVNDLNLARGVAPRASIMSINVFFKYRDPHPLTPPEQPLSWPDDMVKALEHVLEKSAELDIAAVNMSLGGGEFNEPCPEEPQQEVIKNLKSEGIATIIASGNNNWVEAVASPACIPEAIAVGATGIEEEDEYIADFSNQHPEMVDLVAPGANIRAAALDFDSIRDVVEHVGESKSGTSMAAPHVAGAWALLQSATGEQLTVDEIEQTLIETGATVRDEREDVLGRPFNEYSSIRIMEALDELGKTKVVFEVEEEGPDAPRPAAEALVEVNGTRGRTNEQGRATIFPERTGGPYKWSVSKFGYKTDTGIIESLAEERRIEPDVLEESKTDLTFRLEDDEGNIIDNPDDGWVFVGNEAESADDQGVVTFSDVQTRNHRYVAVHDDYWYKQGWIDVGAETQVIKLSVPDTNSVEIEVADPAGNPVEGARVELRHNIPDFPVFDYVEEEETDSDGIAEFDEVEAAEWLVNVSKSGYDRVQTTKTLQQEGLSSIDPTVADELSYSFVLSVDGIKDFLAGPNPFDFSNSKHTEPEKRFIFQFTDPGKINMELEIYSLSGELVYDCNITEADDTVDNDNKAQIYWDLEDNSGSEVSSGYYLYRLKDHSSGDEETGKLAVIK